MSMAENPVYYHKRISSSTVVKPGAGTIGSIFVSAASSTPTIEICDDNDTGAEHVVIGTFTPVAGTNYPLNRIMERGIAIIITGSVDCNVAFT